MILLELHNMLLKFKVILIIIGLFFLSCSKNDIAVYYEEMSVNEDINIHKVVFVNDTVGFACGGKQYEYGAIFKTTNSGRNWNKVYSSNIWNVNDIQFVNDSTGYACGDTLLLLTSRDKGESWQRYWFCQMPFHVNQRPTFKNFYFINDGEFYIIGGQNYDTGILYKTTDAGNSWDFDIFKNELKGISCPDPANIFISGYGVIYKSVDNGDSFKLTSIKGDFYTAIHFIDKNMGIAAGYNGGIYKTNDAGENWETIIKPNKVFEKRVHFNDMKFENNNRGYLIGSDGLLMYTDDGGNEWELTEKFTDKNLISITIVNNNEILITSENGKIYRVIL